MSFNADRLRTFIRAAPDWFVLELGFRLASVGSTSVLLPVVSDETVATSRQTVIDMMATDEDRAASFLAMAKAKLTELLRRMQGWLAENNAPMICGDAFCKMQADSTHMPDYYAQMHYSMYGDGGHVILAQFWERDQPQGEFPLVVLHYNLPPSQRLNKWTFRQDEPLRAHRAFQAIPKHGFLKSMVGAIPIERTTFEWDWLDVLVRSVAPQEPDTDDEASSQHQSDTTDSEYDQPTVAFPDGQLHVPVASDHDADHCDVTSDVVDLEAMD